MLKEIFKRFKSMNNIKRNQNSKNKPLKYFDEEYVVSKNINENLTTLKSILQKSDDIIFREFKIESKDSVDAFICYVDGLGDKKLIEEYIMKALLVDIHNLNCCKRYEYSDLLSYIKKQVISAAEIKDTKVFDDILDAILSGETALYIDGYDIVLIISAKGLPNRGIQEPNTEVVLRGPHEGFTEILRTNTALLRKNIKNPHLIFESLQLGKQTRTDISIAYIEGIADQKILEEVKYRLNRIDSDAILESGYIEQFIEDNPWSLFHTIGNSERPDKVVSKLLEGRIAILCSGTPFVLTVPCLFIENFQVLEDYNTRTLFSSFLRTLRFFAFLTTLLAPSFYVALETFNHEMIPTVYILTAAASREGIPFPSILETIIILSMFELLRESGVRLPRYVGQAVSIVGVLIIGEAAVTAGIISAPMVIIGAITEVSSYVVPPLLGSIVFFRFFILILSASFGLFGTVIGLMILLAHLCSLRSFGVPYMEPIAPVIWQGLKDSFLRFPLWAMKSRPKLIARQNLQRQGQSSINDYPKKDRRED